MKPYLAVLYDSWIEAVSSRVLWILLACWVLILGALFPLAISEGESYLIRSSDVASPKIVMDQLALASTGKGTRAQRVVYSKLPEDFQNALKDRQKTGRRIFVGRLTSSLNQVLEVVDLYDKEAWPTAERREDLKTLIDKESKTPLELQRFNRRLVDLAFPSSISSSLGQATWVTYAGMKFTDPLPFTARQIRPVVESVLIPAVLWIGLGMVAMMVSIVITSSMIPDMFQTGSLHLLLSKPLSRNLLFLSKYLGGCIFVAMNIAILVIGLYFYCGMQLRIWNNGILWCIPLFIFYFMIYYSVSALAGLVWKNPIICVVVTALFWGVCFTVGIVRNLSEAFLKGPPTLQHILVVDNQPVVGNQQGRVQFWNDEATQWQTGYGDVDEQRLLGLVYLPKTGSLYFGRSRFSPFGMRSGEATRLEMARLPEWSSDVIEDPDALASFANKKFWDDIRLDSGPDLPLDTVDLVSWRDTFLAIASNGIYRFDADAASYAEKSKISLFGFDMKLPQAVEPYAKMTDSESDFRRPIGFAASRDSQRCVLYSRSKLRVLEADGSKLVQRSELSLDFPPETVTHVALQERSAIVCPAGYTPIAVDLDTMSISQSLGELGKPTVKRSSVDGRGRVALLDTDGVVWILSPSESGIWRVDRPRLTGQGNASAIACDRSDRLWVAHHTKDMDVWSSDWSKSELSYRPKSTTPEWLFGYIINPLYLIFPKPAAINETIQYVVRNPDNKMPAIDTPDLDLPQIEKDPWQPIWSNAIFIAVMLTLGCWHLYRQDL
jgi:hypothetical protein